ncbi:MAG: protein translocase subunit SecD [Coriobacteriia bacterium]|nr:protein translocase subunit SecD [Coriobacteriia bacterium]
MDPKQRNYLLLAIIAVLVIGSWLMFWPPGTKIKQGLDIQGGISVILTAQPQPGQSLTNDDMDRAELIIRNRVDKLGASETSIQRQGQDSILVQMPGLKNRDEALKMINSTGLLEFVDVSSITDTEAVNALADTTTSDGYQLKPGTYKSIMNGSVVKSASVGQDPTTGKIEVNLVMDAEGTKTWADFTTANVRKQIAIVLDGVVKSAPVVNEPITGGQTAISGTFTADEAKALAAVLQTGALPVKLVPQDTRTVGPTLGQESLRQGLMAVLIGLAIVAVYLIVFYRGLGFVSVTALIVFASIYLGILAVLSRFGLFALSMPGIAGVVLTIGLAADSSILINERFKEEVRMGRTYRSAAQSGTKHAIGTSVDADLVTFVSALVLFLVAIGPVKGFALTLMLGIGCDILMMIMYKRPMIMLLAESVIPKAPALWGVAREGVAAGSSESKKGGVSNG